VTERLEDVAVAIHAHETLVERADPERARLILEHGRNLFVAERVDAGWTDANQRLRVGAPVPDAFVRADPNVARAIECERRNMITAERRRIAVAVTQVLDAPR